MLIRPGDPADVKKSSGSCSWSIFCWLLDECEPVCCCFSGIWDEWAWTWLDIRKKSSQVFRKWESIWTSPTLLLTSDHAFVQACTHTHAHTHRYRNTQTRMDLATKGCGFIVGPGAAKHLLQSVYGSKTENPHFCGSPLWWRSAGSQQTGGATWRETENVSF